jgi:hypothetical protein
VDGLGVPRGVDDPDAVGMAAGDLVIALRDQALQLDPLALEPIGLAAPDPCSRSLGVDAEKDGQVGPDPAGRQVADLLDPLRTEPARHTLVGDARVAEPIADDVAALVPGRTDHLRDQLGSCGAEEQQLGEGV